MQIVKAVRSKAKLRLGIAAPSGAGKTYSALLLGFGLGGKVGIIDTENGSANLYAHLGEYDIITLSSPYTIASYREAIKALETAGYTTIIIDSLSHAWAGEGGLLDKQGKIADGGGNSFAAWRKITPEHNALVEAMLQSPCHIIATMRSKQEYVLETDSRGKSVPKKVGMAPVQREGMEYEFTICFEMDVEHNAHATKDRTSMFDGQYFKITSDTGKKLLTWLEQGVELVKQQPAPATIQTAQPEPAKATPTPASSTAKISGLLEEIKSKKTGDTYAYGLKLAGVEHCFVIRSAPAADRARDFLKKEVTISYQIAETSKGKRYDMLGVEAVATIKK